MSLWEYVGDGTGEVAGVGIVFNGRVVETDVDLSDREDFKPASDGATVTSDEDLRRTISRTPEAPDEEVVAEVEADDSAPAPASTSVPTSVPPVSSLPTTPVSPDPSSETATTPDSSSSQGG